MPGSRAAGFDGMKQLRVSARESDVLLPEPAAFRQQDKDTDERDQQTWAGNTWDREHQTDSDQPDGRRPSRDPLREPVEIYPGDSNASVA
jgi:hypothetical protein